MRDELELTYSLFSLRNGRRFFSHCHYYLWFGSRSTLSGSSVAREGCWDGTFSLPPPPFPVPSRIHPSGTLFPCSPKAARQQSSLFLPQFTPARHHAQPLLAARACSRSWERVEKGAEGRRAGERPGGAFCNGPPACTSDSHSPVSSLNDTLDF